MDLYPLRLTPLLKDKVWGGSALARMFLPQGAPERPIGEAWTAWDQLPVENGPLQGARLGDLVEQDPGALLGQSLLGAGPCLFPLLVKFVAASEMLSIQVHPDDAYASRHEGQAFGKAEMWYVVWAEPGARLIHGVRQPLDRAAVEQAIAAACLPDYLESVEVETGDVIPNPPGTIHALGPGTLLYEIQQSSDLTYRLYDWNRNEPGRPLHLAKALDVANLEPCAAHKVTRLQIDEPGGSRAFLFACRHFALELLQVHSCTVERPLGRRFHILTALEGAGTVQDRETGLAVPLQAGRSVVVPAAVREYQACAEQGPLVLIKSYVPDLREDVVDPLRMRGFSESEIIQLGGALGQADLTRSARWRL